MHLPVTGLQYSPSSHSFLADWSLVPSPIDSSFLSFEAAFVAAFNSFSAARTGSSAISSFFPGPKLKDMEDFWDFSTIWDLIPIPGLFNRYSLARAFYAPTSIFIYLSFKTVSLLFMLWISTWSSWVHKYIHLPSWGPMSSSYPLGDQGGF